jgi:potassium-dependent mechanosensitive channel
MCFGFTMSGGREQKRFSPGQSAMYESTVRRLARIFLFLILACTAGSAVHGQSASPSPVGPAPEPTPIPLANVLGEVQSAMASLQEVDGTLSLAQSSMDDVTDSFGNLTGEIDPRMAEDTKLLQAGPSLDMLYRTKLTWLDFGENLSALSRGLSQRVVSLDDELARLKKLEKSWQVTLQSARQDNAPESALQGVQSVVDSIQQARQAIEAKRAQALTLLTRISDEQTRVRRTLSLVEQSQIRALKDLFVRDSPFVWELKTSLGTEWVSRCGESFASQTKASTAFGKRLPFAFLIHASLVAAIAIALRWTRRRINKLVNKKPELERALPILDLPVATAFVLTVLVSPLIYPEAPRLIQVILAALALIPAVAILRRLLERNLAPILYFLVIMYFVHQLRVLVASVPGLARFLFLGQMLGGFLFLFWLLRSQVLKATAEKTSARFAKAMQVIAIVGLVCMSAAALANVFGYLDLAHLLGMTFLRGLYIAALLYTAIRILEGLIIIALEAPPLSSSRVISLHRSMLERRAFRFLEFLAVLGWLNLMLGFFGLLTPLMTAIKAGLDAGVTIGSLSVSLGAVLAFLIAIWASFLVSRFVRFVLEEDVYHRMFLERGIPYAISTVLHYAVLLVGFFIALGALGIDLTKITILAGAFSVGIGFGLQNVINNFVSGLILLFERPIKIGDIIEVGGNVGEVRRIGIRASIIRTADGSEVIVPNGSLISSQVTNWTLSDRGRAFEVSVSVAAGTDLQRVTELLKKIAADHPDVSKEPAPRVNVANMTASAITFQLRVWTDRIEAWAEVRSDLSLAINEALAREKIVMA